MAPPSRLLPRVFLVLSTLLAGAGCSQRGELQRAVESHCSELERHVDLMAKGYREGRNHFPLLGGELSGDMLVSLYREVTWCASVRVDEGKQLLAMSQELSVLIDEVNARYPNAVKGKALGEGWANPEASAARTEVSGRIDRIAAIVREINQRPLKR